MLSLSHTTGYAVLALGCIGSWKGQRVLSDQIHQCTGIPIPYLRKILHALGRSGLIETKRGYRGGFVLARPPREITLLDVVNAIERHDPLPDCLLGLPGCSEATPCPLRRFWQKHRAQIEAQLARVTIAQAVASVRKGRWGKLVSCPPEEAAPKRGPCGPPARRGRPKGGSRTTTRKGRRPASRRPS